MTELPFFASKVRLGRTGAEEIFSLGPLNEYERSVQREHNLIPCSFYIMISKLGNDCEQGWLGEGKERIGGKHREGSLICQKMSTAANNLVVLDNIPTLVDHHLFIQDHTT